MPLSVPNESALLVRVPAAELGVSRHRDRYDAAARVGVPAHVTIAYPFKPTELLTSIDLDALTDVFARFRPVEVTFARTAWFGDEVLYLEPSDPRPLLALTGAIEKAFPKYPIYGGAYQTVHPHLTVGQTSDRAALLAVERDVLGFLPVRHFVSGVELWQGPALATGLGRWTHAQTFPLQRIRAQD